MVQFKSIHLKIIIAFLSSSSVLWSFLPRPLEFIDLNPIANVELQEKTFEQIERNELDSFFLSDSPEPPNTQMEKFSALQLEEFIKKQSLNAPEPR